MTVKAIIFDMDGVLVDSEYAMRESGIEALKRYGINAKHEDFNEFTGMGEDKFIGGVAEKYGIQYEVPMKDYAYQIYVMKAKGLVYVFDNVMEVLNRAKIKYKIAVASAADLIKVKTNLECIGINTEFFDAVITGSDVRKKKPDPETFLKAAEKIGIQPENCVVFEDAISGIQAAKSAKMKVIGITTSFEEDKLKKENPDYIAKNILEAFEGINSLI